MKKLRILLALLLVLTLALTFSSCGSGGNDNGDEGTSTDQTQDVDDAYGETEDDNDLFDESDEALFDDDEDETDSEDGDDDEEYDDSDDIEVPSSTGDLTGDYTGEFASDTGTALNLVVQWAANEDDDNYNVTLRFYVDSYSIWVGDRDSNVLKVKTSSGTKEYTFKTKELNREDNKQERVLVGEKTITLSADELASGAKVKATWNYRGSYSGTDLSEITASGEIKG